MEHDSRMRAAQIQEEYALFSMLKPSIKKDGNMWCVLYGEDLQEGIAGFGPTPLDAVLAFNRAWITPNTDFNLTERTDK
jgi:hypothetical protein